MGENHFILGGLLLAVFLLCAFWHRHENRQLSHQWKRDLDDFSANWLIRFSWSRTLQLLLILFCGLTLIIIYDWQLGKTRDALETAIAESMKQQEKIIGLEAAAKTNGERIAKLQDDLKQAAQQQSYYPPATTTAAPAISTVAPTAPKLLNEKSSAVSATTAAPVVLNPPEAETIDTEIDTPPSTQHKEGVDDVYNPENDTAGDESSMDRIKKRYETILVNYFFLKKCGQVNAVDYHIITSAMSQEMASVNAPGRLQYDIVTAAQGSYKEFYAKSSCKSPDAVKLQEEYDDYINTISKQFNAQ